MAHKDFTNDKRKLNEDTGDRWLSRAEKRRAEFGALRRFLDRPITTDGRPITPEDIDQIEDILDR